MNRVMGLDLSLRGPAACFIEPSWNGSWERVHTMRAGYDLSGLASTFLKFKRMVVIARHMIEFARQHDITHVFVEDYAYSRQSASVTKLAELRGVINCEFYAAMKSVPEPVPASAARKLLMGKAPHGKKQKQQVIDFLKRAGGEFDSEDEADAFVVANWGMSQVGLRALEGQQVLLK